ncbi:hypothetical protein JTE90_005537 [Oedothorax gibbosus]|uniref:Adenine DNA glycosylase n=1 Tax=Oedothorax gibbosus TaxID=931172 RepID=A0AAV6VAW4_9ARAC|nr:hypothetical protein JTE90_005537 [Oedothorax gibbosus]
MAGKKDSKSKKKAATSPKLTNICHKHSISEEDIKSVQTNLLKWYDMEQRTLPWRDIAKTEQDPNIRGYSVWVSEVMLQQTQVATVIPYFNKWIKQWPTVESLSMADVEDVLRTWAGLGYYSRGRRLHEGAKIVTDKLGGNIPNNVPELMKLLPGIGAYSASAIASVAFQKPVGVVDGNVVRVLSRMRILGSPVSQTQVREHLWDLANKMVSPARPGDFNQALMELGATVCTPQNPNCSSCPVNSNCSAYLMTKDHKVCSLDSFMKKDVQNKKVLASKSNNIDVPDIENIGECSFCLPTSVWHENPQVTAFPCKVEKKSARQEKVTVLVIKRAEKLFLTRRPEKGLLAGLWEFPSCIVSEDSDKGIKSAFESIARELGVPTSVLSSKSFVGEVIHLFSHIHTTYIVNHIVLENSVKMKSTKKENMWITEEEFNSAAVSTAMKKVLAIVKKADNPPKKEVKSKKRKLSAEDSKQTSIKSFFK